MGVYIAIHEDLATAKSLMDRYGSKRPAEPWGQVCDVMSRSFTTISEVVLMSVVEDEELSIDVKRGKINRQLAKVSEASETFCRDIEKSLHGRVVKQAVGKLVTP